MGRNIKAKKIPDTIHTSNASSAINLGIIKSDCPKGKEDQTRSESSEQPQATLTTLHAALVVTKQEINPMWILCDSESTVDVFRNRDILVNIKKTDKPIR